MASLKEVKRLSELCEKYELEGREVIHGFSNTQLGSLYNGIGPESFPGWLRAVIDFLHPSLEPVAFIHDVEWSESENAPNEVSPQGRKSPSGHHRLLVSVGSRRQREHRHGHSDRLRYGWTLAIDALLACK